MSQVNLFSKKFGQPDPNAQCLNPPPLDKIARTSAHEISAIIACTVPDHRGFSVEKSRFPGSKFFQAQHAVLVFVQLLEILQSLSQRGCLTTVSRFGVALCLCKKNDNIPGSSTKNVPNK